MNRDLLELLIPYLQVIPYFQGEGTAVSNSSVFMENAKVMAKGQVTIPKDVRRALGLESGDRVLFVVEGDSVRMVNAAAYAMKVLQQQMDGAAEDSGLIDEEAILAATKEARREVANE